MPPILFRDPTKDSSEHSGEGGILGIMAEFPEVDAGAVIVPGSIRFPLPPPGSLERFSEILDTSSILAQRQGFPTSCLLTSYVLVSFIIILYFSPFLPPLPPPAWIISWWEGEAGRGRQRELFHSFTDCSSFHLTYSIKSSPDRYPDF